jgi:hypothetical protein
MKLALLVMFTSLALGIYGMERRGTAAAIIGLAGFVIAGTAILTVVCR